MNEDTHLRVLRILERNPKTSQRELSRELGISLGKTNYCIRALLQKGWIKTNNFKNNRNKLAYAYLLTPAGLERKAEMAAAFLKRKMIEYEQLKEEIERVRQELDG